MALPFKNNEKCLSCPYKLGIVKTLVNPCPECKKNGYNMSDTFKEKSKAEELNSDKN